MFDCKMIETFAAGGQKLRESVRGLSTEQMGAFPIPGTWSIQQIVVHLNDSDAVGIDRMKRIAAMDNPLLIGYDETAYMRALLPQEQPAQKVIELFDLSRQLWALTLRKLPEQTFARTGVHSERGKISLGELVADYVRHLDHHMAFIYKKREMLLAR